MLIDNKSYHETLKTTQWTLEPFGVSVLPSEITKEEIEYYGSNLIGAIYQIPDWEGLIRDWAEVMKIVK